MHILNDAVYSSFPFLQYQLYYYWILVALGMVDTTIMIASFVVFVVVVVVVVVAVVVVVVMVVAAAMAALQFSLLLELLLVLFLFWVHMRAVANQRL